jgi:serine/threonine protein kinase
MAPEIHLNVNTESTIEDMKKGDFWSFGMTLHCLMNPGINHPYSYNCLHAGQELTRKNSHRVYEKKKLLKHDPTYESLLGLEWSQIEEVLVECLNFYRDCRPSASQVETSLTSNQGCEVSSTAMEVSDQELAKEMCSALKNLLLAVTPENDGTNACALIALAICNWFLGTETILGKK